MALRSPNLYRLLQPLLLCVLLVTLLLLTMSLLIVLIPVWGTAAAYWHLSEKRLLRRLRGSGRFLPGGEVFRRISSGEGSLVLEAERDTGGILRVWWLPDGLAKLYPDMPW